MLELLKERNIHATCIEEGKGGREIEMERNGFRTRFVLKPMWQDNAVYMEKIILPQFEERERNKDWMKER